MELEQILELIDHVSGSRLTSFSYENCEVKLSMEREKGQDAKPAVSAEYTPRITEQAKKQTEPEKEEGKLIRAPLVGTFYSAPSEEAAPFASVGDRIKKGQVVAIVEAMKLMNEIESDFDGEIAEIYVKNGDAVEYGQPLFRVI